MKNSFFTSLCFIIFSATFIILSDCSDHNQSKEIIPLFVFGDSFFDPGNNNYINTTNDFRANFLPYGETFFKYATGRFSDGRLLPDFIAEYAKLPLIPPYLEKGQKKNWVYGVNFASGGGGALVETHSGKAIDLKTQLGYFQNVEKELQSQLGNNEAKHLLSNSVYLFSVGVNDVTAPSSIFSSYSSQDYVSIVIGNYTQVIKELHKKGARKFGFASLFPVGCGPYSKAHNNNKGVNGLQCVEELTSLTKLYNAALSQRLQDLEKQLIGFCYSNFDTFGVAMDMIHNPSKYGFEDVENACCGSGAYGGEFTCGGMRGVKEYELCKDPESHLFFDSYHPSEKGHRLLAELMWHGVPNITWPFNLKSLFGLTSCEGEFIKEHVLLPSVWTNPPRGEIEGNSESMIINGLSSVGGKLGIRSKISYAHSLMLLML